MSRKNLLASRPPIGPTRAQLDPVAAKSEGSTPTHQRVAAVRSLGMMLDGMQEASERAEQVYQQLASADRIVDIHPRDIDPSPVRDRIPDPESADNRALAESIVRDGQQVPVLLRPHPERPGRYLTIYGHRRIAVLATQNKSVRAIIADLDDDEALAVQGLENNARSNTSFIERCLYAKRLSDRRMTAQRIASVLMTSRSVVAESISLAAALPEPLILAIGPAPSIGRPRWQALATAHLSSPEAWKAVVQAPEFPAASSDERFAFALSRLTSAGATPSRSQSRVCTDDLGKYAVVKRTAAALTCKIPLKGADRQDGVLFADWIESRLPALREDYVAGK